MKTISVELFLICLLLLVINQFLFGNVDRAKVENGIKSFNRASSGNGISLR